MASGSFRAVVVSLTACGVLDAGAGVPARTPQNDDAATTALVERASAYVVRYVDAFSAIVSEERQIQKQVRADGRVRKTRELVSDFLLVKIVDGGWLSAYRDVISVDGKPVRNREDRLRKLFLDHPNQKAADLAAAIARESGRYNLGLGRAGNSPLLPLIFLTKRIVPGVRFTMTGPGSLKFEEVKTPSVLGRRTGGKRFDLLSRGAFEIDPQSGRVLEAEMTAAAADSKVSPTFRVRYAHDPALELSVPVEVTERYARVDDPKEDRLEVVATYSAFRRFQVSTAEKIK